MYFRRARTMSTFSVLRRHKSPSEDTAVIAPPSAGTSQCLNSILAQEPPMRLSIARAATMPITATVVTEPAAVPKTPEPPDEAGDLQYQLVVLQLPQGVTEAELDRQTDQEATEVGLSNDTSIDNAELLKAKHLSKCESDVTAGTRHIQSGSTSRASHSTGITSVHSVDQPAEQVRKDAHSEAVPGELRAQRSMSFNEYQSFLAQARAQEKISAVLLPPPIPSSFPSSQAPSVFSASSRKPPSTFRTNLRRLSTFRKLKDVRSEEIRSCNSCGSSADACSDLITLRCKHSYCPTCLSTIVLKGPVDPDMMPPSCCSKPLPPDLVMQFLPSEQRSAFQDAILQHTMPLDDRMFCPTLSCGSFDPGTGVVNIKCPLEGSCEDCGARSCKLCKGPAHPSGLTCPSDWHNVVISLLDPDRPWRRCYACRILLQRDDGFVRLICKCGAQSCYKCGAVWDKISGCPNNCIPQEELDEEKSKDEKRHKTQEELEEEAAAAVMRTQEEVNALQRSLEHKDLQALRSQQMQEMNRFLVFEKDQRQLMWSRQEKEKGQLRDSHAVAETKVKVKQFELASIVEDRQVSAEMELRKVLDKEQKSLNIRLRHMEAYVNAVQTHQDQYPRVVSERDRNELGQQHNIRDDMERLHQSKINVLRDKQAQQLEAISIRQQEERSKLTDRHAADLRTLEDDFAAQERMFDGIFQKRRDRLSDRWSRVEAVSRKQLEVKDSVVYGPLPRLPWFSLDTDSQNEHRDEPVPE